jgi:hypothetical protein
MFRAARPKQASAAAVLLQMPVILLHFYFGLMMTA